jgi:hypothetical protein
METSVKLLAVAPFDLWEYDDVVRELREKVPVNYNRLRAYAVDGDHFQAGKEWVGPGQSSGNDDIFRQFAPDDAVNSVLTNISSAFNEPQVGAVPLHMDGDEITDEMRNLMAEATQLISNWWDRHKLQEHLQERQRTGAWAGYAGLRLWIPWRFLVQNGGEIYFRTTSNIEEAMSYIHVMAPMPDKGGILIDTGTQDVCAVYMDIEVEYDERGEKHTYERAELVYLDPNRARDEDADTIIRIVYSDKKRQGISYSLKMNGLLWYSEMKARPLLSDAVLRTQQQLNFISTILTRIAETAGFRERYLKNAKPQGYRLPYEDGGALAQGSFLERDEEGRLWQVIPQARTLGAATTTELVGLPQYDEKGDQKGHQMPDITVLDPVDPKPYLHAADVTRHRILRMCGQGHLGGTSNAEVSGIAYEQARAVFEKDLNARRIAEEGMLRDLLMSVLFIAEHIAGKRGYFTSNLRLTVDQHVNAGPRSPDLVRLDLESYEAGGLSLETLMSRIGVEDVNAEMVRVARNTSYILDVLENSTKLTETFTKESVLEVLKKLNMPRVVIDALVPVEQEPEVTMPIVEEP